MYSLAEVLLTQQKVNMATTPSTIDFGAPLDSITDPTIKAKIKTILDQADIPKTVIGKDAGMQGPLRDVLGQNSNDQRNWVLTKAYPRYLRSISPSICANRPSKHWRNG